MELNWRSPGFELNDIGFLAHADLVQERFWTGDYSNNPVGRFRYLNVSAEHLARWNFNREHLFNEVYMQVEGQFQNYWDFYVRSYLRADELSTTVLRGGPSMKNEGSHEIDFRLSTDKRKTLSYSFSGEERWSHDGFSDQYTNR